MGRNRLRNSQQQTVNKYDLLDQFKPANLPNQLESKNGWCVRSTCNGKLSLNLELQTYTEHFELMARAERDPEADGHGESSESDETGDEPSVRANRKRKRKSRRRRSDLIEGDEKTNLFVANLNAADVIGNASDVFDLYRSEGDEILKWHEQVKARSPHRHRRYGQMEYSEYMFESESSDEVNARLDAMKKEVELDWKKIKRVNVLGFDPEVRIDLPSLS